MNLADAFDLFVQELERRAVRRAKQFTDSDDLAAEYIGEIRDAAEAVAAELRREPPTHD